MSLIHRRDLLIGGLGMAALPLAACAKAPARPAATSAG